MVSNPYLCCLCFLVRSFKHFQSDLLARDVVGARIYRWELPMEPRELPAGRRCCGNVGRSLLRTCRTVLESDRTPACRRAHEWKRCRRLELVALRCGSGSSTRCLAQSRERSNSGGPAGSCGLLLRLRLLVGLGGGDGGQRRERRVRTLGVVRGALVAQAVTVPVDSANELVERPIQALT